MEKNKNISLSGNSKLFAFKLEGVDLPKFVEKSNKDWVSAGKDNKWFNYLVDLFQSSPLHGGIVRSVIENVKGRGLRIKDGEKDARLEAFIEKCNSKGESLDDVLAKIVTDFIFFGGFYASTIWSRGKENFEIYHTDYSTIRSGKVDVHGNVNEYYFSSNWFKNTPDVTAYPVFSSENRTGTQIYFAKHSYIPGIIYYPLPLYISAIPVIEADGNSWVLNNNEISQGYFPHIHLAYHNGIPTPEIQEQNSANFRESFEGPAGIKVIETYDNGGDTSTDIKGLTLDNGEGKFLKMAELIMTAMLSAWRIPSGELLGIQQVSKLGAGNIEEASALLENIVIKPLRKFIEDELNYLLAFNGFTTEVEIIPCENVKSLIPVNDILAIQTSISNGTTQYDAAIKMLTLIYNLEEATAKAIIGEKIEKPAPAQLPQQPLNNLPTNGNN